MKIGLHIELYLYIEHDAELIMANLTSEWSRIHQVDLIQDGPPLTRERIETSSLTALSE
jgi:hypothetical protein